MIIVSQICSTILPFSFHSKLLLLHTKFISIVERRFFNYSSFSFYSNLSLTIRRNLSFDHRKKIFDWFLIIVSQICSTILPSLSILNCNYSERNLSFDCRKKIFHWFFNYSSFSFYFKLSLIIQWNLSFHRKKIFD